jgi:protein-L-isoaspartate(D-aspartate) O-methyltransferase
MAPDEAGLRSFIERYVRELTAAGAIRSPGVERAFRTVQRHRLLETFYLRAPGARGPSAVHHDPASPRREHLELIYSDDALATRFIGRMPASSTSAPSLVARMLELLGLAEGMKVLEIGAGTGYNAALMAEITGDQELIVTIDVLDDVVEQTRRLLAGAGYPRIRVLARDGFDGAPEEAPFDRIVATVGCSDLSPHWAGQLADGGAMLVPLEHSGGHPLLLLRKDGTGLRGRIALWTGFVPVHGMLHIDGLWPLGYHRPGPGELIRAAGPWPGFGARRPSGPPGSADLAADEIDFLFFLGLSDRRAGWLEPGPGLNNGPDGWAAAGPDGIWWWKDASLAAQLDRLYREWAARDRPAISDYQVTFLPAGAACDLPAGGWQVERRFYRELLTAG